MSSIMQPNVLTYKATAAIAKGCAVKIGADNQHVSICSAKTDKSVGIAQNAVTTADDKVEVAHPGGGAKALAGGTISAGDLLAPTTDGSLITTTTANDRIIAVALEDAVVGDMFAVQVVISNY